MQLARRTSLIVVLLLLASVGTASAEWAWVLWQQRDLDATEPMAAFDSLQACRRALDYELARTEGLDPEFVLVRDTTVHFLYVRTDTGFWTTMVVRYTCLPDTTDPRGPKTK